MSFKVATITLNPAYDLVGFCPKIDLGDVNSVRTNGFHAAGKGINVAKVLRDLDLNVTASGFLGKENCEGFIQLLDELKIENQFQMVFGKTRINVKLTDEIGEVTDFNFSGFSVTKEDWLQFSAKTLSKLKNFDMISINGSFPAGIELDLFTNWMKELTKNCKKVIFDSSKEALIAGIKANPYLIKPNHKELEIWTKKSLKTQNEIIAAAKDLVFQGIENVVVSLGSKGALWITKDEIWQANPPVCENVVSTVGAGDSMVAGLMQGLLMKKSIAETFCFASAIAALSVNQTNVGISDHRILENMMNKIKLTTIK